MKIVSRGDVETLESNRGEELNNISIGLGWHAAGTAIGRDTFDLDVSLALLDSNGKAHARDDLVFYDHKEVLDGLIYHSGDNTYGGEDDDEDDQEVITIRDMRLIPARYQRLRIATSVHKAKINGYNFGMVENAYLRVLDNENDMQLMRYDLSGDFFDQTCVVVADLERDRSKWTFNAVGVPVEDGFGGLLRQYGFVPRGVAA